MIHPVIDRFWWADTKAIIPPNPGRMAQPFMTGERFDENAISDEAVMLLVMK